MTGRNWTNGDLAVNSGTDPATIGDFLAGRRWPRPATLGKIEDALGLTPGTLAALGEEARFRLGQSLLGGGDVLGRDMSDISDAELAAELTYRLESMRREISRLRERLSRMVEEPGEGASPQSTADTPPPAKRDLVVEVLDEDDVVVISDVRQPMRHSRRVTPE